MFKVVTVESMLEKTFAKTQPQPQTIERTSVVPEVNIP